MKTYLVLAKYRHSVIEFFDDLVAKKQVDEFFIGSIDPESEMFPLTYQIAEEYKDIAFPHFHPFYSDKQYEYRTLSDINPVKQLQNTLAHISMGNSCHEQNDAVDAIMDYCEISLSMVDFEDDGHFKVEASLEWQ